MRSDKLRQTSMEVTVGTFMFMVLLALGFFTIILSRENIFSKNYIRHVRFNDVSGLLKGDKAYVYGVDVGRVKSMRVEHGNVLITLLLRDNIALHRDCKISIQPSSVLGGRYVAIIPGSESEPLIPMEETIQGEPSVDFIGEASEAVKAVRKALESGGVLDNLEATMSNLRDITDDIDAGKGTVGKLVKDEELYNSIRDITAKINDGQGTLGKLVNDDSVYQDLQKIADNLKDVSGRLAAGKGTIGKLLSEDDTLYNDLSAAVKSLREVADSVNKGEGTLGRLAKDDELYNQATKLFEELRATIDDIRETSPVTSFSSVFFGAF